MPRKTNRPSKPAPRHHRRSTTRRNPQAGAHQRMLELEVRGQGQDLTPREAHELRLLYDALKVPPLHRIDTRGESDKRALAWEVGRSRGTNPMNPTRVGVTGFLSGRLTMFPDMDEASGTMAGRAVLVTGGQPVTVLRQGVGRGVKGRVLVTTQWYGERLYGWTDKDYVQDEDPYREWNPANPRGDAEDRQSSQGASVILAWLRTGKTGTVSTNLPNYLGSSLTVRRHDDGDLTATVTDRDLVQQGPEVVVPEDQIQDVYHYALHHGTLEGWEPGSGGYAPVRESNPVASPVVAEIARQLANSGMSRHSLAFVAWDENTLKVSRNLRGALIRYNAGTDLYDVTPYDASAMGGRAPFMSASGAADQGAGVVWGDVVEGLGVEQLREVVEPMLGGRSNPARSFRPSIDRVEHFRPRFIQESQVAELANLWHTSRVHSNSRYERMQYTAKWFAKEHPEVSSTAAYKDLDGLLSNWFGQPNPAASPEHSFAVVWQWGHDRAVADRDQGKPPDPWRQWEHGIDWAMRKDLYDRYGEGGYQKLQQAFAGGYVKGYGIDHGPLKRLEMEKPNPTASPEQYRLAQAVLSGTARGHMSEAAAREIVERTPAGLRSEYNRYTVNPGQRRFYAATDLGEFHVYDRTGLDRDVSRQRYATMEAAQNAAGRFNDQDERAGRSYREYGEYIKGATPNPDYRNEFSAFDAGKTFRTSGAYYETGVANARVAKYGFNKWLNNQPKSVVKAKTRLMKEFMEGWAAGKRVEAREGNPDLFHVDKYDDRATEMGTAYRYGRRAGGARMDRDEARVRFENESYKKWLHLYADVKARPQLEAEWRRGYSDTMGERQHNPGPGGDYAVWSHSKEFGVQSPTVMHFRTVEQALHAAEELVSHRHTGKVEVVHAPTGQVMHTWEGGSWMAHRRGNPTDSAAALYEEFHGVPSTEEVVVTEEVRYHGNLAGLGDLVEIVVRTPSGYKAVLDFDKSGTLLCSSEDGKQLYLRGGDQSIDLDAIHMSGDEWLRDSMLLGTILKLTYRTAKKFDDLRVLDYEHKAGEESGVRPELIYDVLNNQLSVAGGQYDVRSEGIVN